MRRRRHCLAIVSAHVPCPDVSKRTSVAAADQLIDVLKSILLLCVRGKGAKAGQQKSGEVLEAHDAGKRANAETTLQRAANLQQQADGGESGPDIFNSRNRVGSTVTRMYRATA